MIGTEMRQAHSFDQLAHTIFIKLLIRLQISKFRVPPLPVRMWWRNLLPCCHSRAPLPSGSLHRPCGCGGGLPGGRHAVTLPGGFLTSTQGDPGAEASGVISVMHDPGAGALGLISVIASGVISVMYDPGAEASGVISVILEGSHMLCFSSN